MASIVSRVVADSIDQPRLEGLYRLGVDEVCYRRQRYLTVVADHDRGGRVVWAKEGRDAATLGAFFDQRGEEARARLEAVTLDMGAAYAKATSAKAPQARQGVDPFHVIKLANEAIDKTRRWAWRSYERSPRFARSIKGTVCPAARTHCHRRRW
ncbi:MAG: ISL3 family transposase [Actinomycetota bacterium]